jgi:potassium-transporting ATPase KdpC subunit
MLTEVVRQIKTAISLLVFFTLLTGLIYPGIITGIAQLFFPWQANGSLINQNGKIVGSVLIGQSFTNSNYFWGRPSATSPYPYNAANSSGSNLGPSNPDLFTAISGRVETFHQADPDNHAFIPVDLVTASGSGLDPDISPLAAMYQIHRIAKVRGLSEQAVQGLIQQLVSQRTFGILGEPRINVLSLNLALDRLHSSSAVQKSG